MISALFSSRPNGTKNFSKNGVCFGCLTIIEMWERDIKRTASGKLSSLPGMQQRYIIRDSCLIKGISSTSGNVRPPSSVLLSDTGTFSVQHPLISPSEILAHHGWLPLIPLYCRSTSIIHTIRARV